MFALNTVLFPGATVPLHVFEDRYRALVRDLLAFEDPTARVFGVTAIREGYEVGQATETTGRQSLYTTGTAVQLVAHDRLPDGRFDIEVVGRQRLRMLELDSAGEYPVGIVETLSESEGTDAASEAAKALTTFERYRRILSGLRGGPVLTGSLPRDPTYLAWSLAGACLLTLPQRQHLLEADDTATRLRLIRHSLNSELRAMQALPSLPATEVARTRWNPN